MEWFKKWRDKLSFLSLPLCFFSLISLDFTLRFFYRFAGNTRFLAWKPMLFTAAWALLLTALISLLPALGRRIAMGVLGVLFALLAVLHGVIFRLVGKMFSFSDMNFAGDGAKFFSWSYLNLRKAFYLCIFLSVLLMVLAILLAKKPEKPKLRYPLRLILSVAASAAAVAAIVCAHSASLPKADNMWWGTTYDPVADGEYVAYKEFTDSNRCLFMTGLYQYTFRNFVVSAGLEGDHQSAEKLDEFYERRSREISGTNEMTAALKDKNLIMIMLESIDTWLVTEDYMPNLYALRRDGIEFTNFYSPVYLSAATFTTEIVSQTGLIPAVSGLSSSAYSTNAFPLALANQFEELGYVSNSFHSASPTIYSRGTVHPNLGFEAYHFYPDLGMENYQLDSQLMNGYEQIVPDGKFFSYIITYSGHGPYNGEMGELTTAHLAEAQEAVKRSGLTGSPENMAEYTEAVAHAMETDQFIGELVDRLARDGKLEDTVLLLYADHYGKYMSDREFLLKIKGVPGDGVSLYRTPCILYGGGLSARKVEKVCATVDLVPTLNNLFALPADRKYYIGDDMFGDEGGVIPLPNYGWYDGKTVYYSDYNGEITEEIAANAAAVKEKMTASTDTLKTDYFARGVSGS